LGLKERAKQELRKKPEKRGLLWASALTLALVFDEFVKEGYLFNPKEVAQPLTHEFLIALIWATYSTLLAVLKLARRRKRKAT